jgi:hypothetical protein
MRLMGIRHLKMWVFGEKIPNSEIRDGFQSTFVQKRLYKVVQRLSENQVRFQNPELFSRKPSVMSAGTSCVYVCITD